MRVFLMVLFGLIAIIINAQESLFVRGNNALKSSRYLSALNIFIEDEQSYTEKYPNYQLLSTLYSFVGEDSLAEQTFLKDFGKESNKLVDSVSIPENPKVVDALNYLESVIDTQRIVIVNESHHKPKHRIFSYELLKVLKEKGFTHLALEAFFDSDNSFDNRGYPLVLENGFYSSEPVFGNLLRKAHELGFKIFGYDFSPPCNYYKDKPNYCQNIRELYQASVIAKVIWQNPSAKVFVHCGHGHIMERTNNDRIFMAEKLKILTGIDPLTIIQTNNPSNRLNNYYDAPLENKPFVLLSSEDPYIHKSAEGFYDIALIWPKTNYKYGRATYRFLPNDFKAYDLNENIEQGSFVQVYKENEGEGAVPTDQFIVKDSTINYHLSLPKGKFIVKIKNENDSLLESFNFVAD